MKLLLNILLKVLGAFLTAYGVLMTKQNPLSPGWIIGLLTIGLTLLFIPEIK